jgi:hypothetical protein
MNECAPSICGMMLTGENLVLVTFYPAVQVNIIGKYRSIVLSVGLITKILKTSSSMFSIVRMFLMSINADHKV